MCTSVVVNKKKTIIGWNLDILNMKHRIRVDDNGVYIEIEDAIEGWMPLFGANSRGDFVGMPACWPYDKRSDPNKNAKHIIHLDIDLLLEKATFEETKKIVETNDICSVPGLTFMGALSDKNGNVLHVIPGQGYKYYEKPDYKILTNFSPFKGKMEEHPWMGWDRYQKVEALLKDIKDDFDVDDMFNILKEASQEVCPTVVSMVYDIKEKTVYWCENRNWDARVNFQFRPKDEFIACCGLDCKTCEAYNATVNNDDELRKKVALLWSKLNQVEITKDMINCTGCRIQDGPKTPYCGYLCSIRKCVQQKGVATCGECDSLNSCENIKMIITNNAAARHNLNIYEK